MEIVRNWYSKLSVVIRWNGCESNPLAVLSGVRQGGLLSPAFFNLYVDVFPQSLRQSHVGCYLRQAFMGCIMYADDMLLISASVIEQIMLDSCGVIGHTLGLAFKLQ